MTQILVQTQGFDLTAALENACHQVADKLITDDTSLEKVEFFLQTEGKRDGKLCSAKIKLSRPGDDIFLEEKNADMYLAIRTAGKKAKQLLHHAPSA